MTQVSGQATDRQRRFLNLLDPKRTLCMGPRDFEGESRKCLGTRDPEDWPTLAAALAVDFPIWTAYTDFFGRGFATCTSASIDIFLDQ